MAEAPPGDDAAEVEVVDGRRVDARRQGERVADEAVFEFGDELGLPAQALDLPGAEGEGGDGDDCCQSKSISSFIARCWTFR